MRMNTDANKTKPLALITGGAKRIGAFLAEKLAAEGYDIVLHYHRSAADAQTLAERLRGYGAQVTLRAGALDDAASIPAIWQGLPPVSLLINNASSYTRDTIATMQPAELQAHVQVNMLAPILMAQAFAAQLPAGQQGNIILLSDSAYGWSISPHFFSYSISKIGLTGATDLLASALAPHIRVNTLALGPTLSGEMDSEEMFARIASRSPLMRSNDPEQVWQALSMLLTTPSLTGQVLELSSGLALRTHRPAVS